MAAAASCLRALLLPTSWLHCGGLQRAPSPQHSAIGIAIAARRAQHRRHLAARAAADGSGGGAAAAATAAAAGSAFETLAGPTVSETEVKKSRFVTHAWPCSSADEAAALIAAARDPSASHNCWAFKVGQQYRSSDDGEPGGTAGRPILSAIEGEGLDGVAVLVIRFFGGIKLGAGGLVRAYGGAARDCLRTAPRRLVTPQVRLRLQVPFDLLGVVYSELERQGATKEEESYDDAAGAALVVSAEAAAAERLAAAVTDATSGRVRAELLPSS